MNKKRIITVFLVVIIALVSVKLFIKSNVRFGGAVISGSIGGFNLDTAEGFSKDDESYIMNMCLSKRKNGVDITSQKAKVLGTPTNTIGLYLSNKLAVGSSQVYDYYIWLGKNDGYIQNQEETKIYSLSNEEYKFLIDCYLKYHSYDEIKTMISKEY